MSSIESTIGSVLMVKESAVEIQIAYAVQAKTLDAARQQGQAAVQLVEQAAQLGKAIGSGKSFDAVG